MQPFGRNQLAHRAITIAQVRLDYFGDPGGLYTPSAENPRARVFVTGSLGGARTSALVAALQEERRANYSAMAAAELISHAWSLWGAESVQMIDGDFALVVLEPDSGQLTLVRDRFGIVPLHYTAVSSTITVSNILRSLLACTRSFDDLDEERIADFLLFGTPQNSEGSIYRQISLVPPASMTSLTDGSISVTRYWQLSTDQAEVRGDDTEIAGELERLLRSAVSDARKRRSTCILTSSGMDSASIAAIAQQQSRSDPGCGRTLIASADSPNEPEFSERAAVEKMASELELELLSMPTPASGLLERSEAQPWPAPDPCWHQWNRIMQPGIHLAAKAADLGMTGQGGDLVLFPNRNYLFSLLKRGRLFRWVHEYRKFHQAHSRRPPFGVKYSIWQQWKTDDLPTVPKWFRPDAISEFGLEHKLKGYIQSSLVTTKDEHPFRPQAYRQLTSTYLNYVLAGHSPSTTGAKMDFAHPFLDLRVITFALGIRSPALLYHKRILRLAMEGILPREILQQGKRIIPMAAKRELIVSTEGSIWDAAVKGLERFDSILDLGALQKIAARREQLNSAESLMFQLPVVMSNWYISQLNNNSCATREQSG